MTKSYQGFEGDLELANSARSGLATLRARDSSGNTHTLSLDPDSGELLLDGTPYGEVITGSNANGYYRLYPDGFIEQWQKAFVVGSTSSATWTFPVAFSTAAEVVVWSNRYVGESSYNRVLPAGSPVAASVIMYNTNSGTSATANLIAHGY